MEDMCQAIPKLRALQPVQDLLILQICGRVRMLIEQGTFLEKTIKVLW